MEVFIVTRTGVYDQGCGGVFDSLEKAVEAAVEFAKMEPDNYHTWEVEKFILNVMSDFDSDDQGIIAGGCHVASVCNMSVDPWGRQKGETKVLYTGNANGNSP